MLHRSDLRRWRTLAPIPQLVRPLLLLTFLVSSLTFCLWFSATKPSVAAPDDGPLVQPQANQWSILPDRFLTETDSTWAVAWGDVDNDGDLDLAVGNDNGTVMLYKNDDGVVQESPSWRSPIVHRAFSLAWGDMNGDGYLDLAVGHVAQPIIVYENEAGELSRERWWQAADNNNVRSLAWGDLNGDGQLDLAVGISGGIVKIYLNQGVRLQPTAELVLNVTTRAPNVSVAWGDADNNGKLDLAVGTTQSITIYFNDAYTLTAETSWVYNEPGSTFVVAWGYLDDDNWLDLAVGNLDNPSKVYVNNRDRTFATSAWVSGHQSDVTVSLAWGDVDNDGYFDLAVGNAAGPGAPVEPARVYRNISGTLETTASWNAPESENTRAIAWGDMDGDGDLDLAAGRLGPDTIYRNHGSTIRPTLGWRAPITDDTYSLAWGDLDQDGDLDLAVGNGPGRPNLVYRNDNPQLVPINWTPRADLFTHSVAWGDVNGDGHLDLAVGNSDPAIAKGAVNEVYLSDGQKLEDMASWSSDEADSTFSVAWGDVDGDGDLDLAVGNYQGPNKIYYNNNGFLEKTATWVSADSDRTTSIAWGDVDKDGDLDLAVANTNVPSKVYLNQQGTLARTASWHSPHVIDSQSIAWGDMNGDGYLDLAIGSSGQPTKVFLNERGQLQRVAAWSSSGSYNARSVAWGDVDGDGDLDLVTGNVGEPIKLYVNEGGMLAAAAAWSSSTSNPTRSVAWGDVDGDGDLDLAVGNRADARPTYNEIYLNERAAYPGQNGATVYPPSVAIQLTSDPVLTFANWSTTALAPANFYATAAIRQARIIPFAYTLFHPTSQSIARVRAYYSLDGSFSGARRGWHIAHPADDTLLTDLSTSPYPTRTVANTYTFNWDLWKSQFFGQSDHVVVRIEALPDYKPRPNTAPGFFQYPLVAAQTFPFRVRGTQIRVVDATSAPVSNGLVYRIPAQQPERGLLIGNDRESFRTITDGYLQGRGELQPNDRLLALQPIRTTGYYTLYHTSGPPTEAGIDGFSVTTNGVQTLTVSADHPLLLFDLTVSLEWEEGDNTSFLSTLRRDLLESSKALYDWSNGQVALGKVTVFQGREHWDDAHIQLLASNQVRPSANLGGVVTTTTVLTHALLTEPITATRGIVRIGPNWTRYGDNDPNFIYDWPRVLAHEFGHYLLFLEDTYLGLDQENGLLVPVTTCRNSAMTDPYDASGTEFRYRDEHWQAECAHTLAELPDWEMIRLAYPALHGPPPTNAGPGTMPFLFTTVELQPPPTASPVRLIDPLISLGDAASALLGGRVYLRRPHQQLIDLGKYTGNELLVRGGQEGDELCLFASATYACSTLSNNRLATFRPQPLWTPLVAVTPTSTRTLTIFVESAAGSQVTATIYPDGIAPQTVLVTTGSPQQITLNQPAIEALVEITGAGEGQRLITGYSLGSGPGRLVSFDGPGRLVSFDGPVSSSDGGVVLYPPLQMDKETFIALQLATQLPPLPLGLVSIGRAYYLRPSAPLQDYNGGSIAFQYLGRDASQFHIPEENLAVYYWNGSTWACFQCVQQKHNLAQNIVSAPLAGAGLYMLAGFQLPLTGSALNPIGYPLPYSLPVTQALSALEDFYTVIYHYDVNQPSQPWTAYGVDAPAWVNTLVELKPNQSYWLYVTESIRWSIVDVAKAAALAPTLQQPPSIFYGVITPTATFTPTVEMLISATVNNNLCGQARTRLVDDHIVYAVFVECGSIGQPVSFVIADRNVVTTAPWDNRRIQQFDLGVGNSSTATHHLYLPLIANR